MNSIEEKISIAKCRTLLKNTGRAYTDEQLKKIRDFALWMAELAYRVYQNDKDKTTS